MSMTNNRNTLTLSPSQRLSLRGRSPSGAAPEPGATPNTYHFVIALRLATHDLLVS
jgi:hypothetical protein